MAGAGDQSANMKLARQMLEACRFIYKAYAQTCVYPLDPFFEAQHGLLIGKGMYKDTARTRLMAEVHQQYKSTETKLDPVEYDLSKPPNPHEGVVYRGGVEDEPYIFFQPREFDLKIASYSGFALDGQKVDGGGSLPSVGGRRVCAFFQGKTGMTPSTKLGGWPSWLGAVVYDPTENVAFVIFRGSRSGNGARAALGAQFMDKGSPDWVTDMNYMLEEHVNEWGGVKACSGFYYAYKSSRVSLLAAYKAAVGGATPATTYFTGHSLGGGLAQAAYLDWALTRADKGPYGCFALSAPPVIIGLKAVKAISMAVDASSLHHYYCPGDAVHASPLLDTSLIPKGMRFANWLTGSAYHPATHPVHLGSECQLFSESPFPEAHEPRDLFRGMNGGGRLPGVDGGNGDLDGEFWPTFKLGVTQQGGPYLSDFTSGFPADQLEDALTASLTPEMALARALQWKGVIQNDSRGQLMLEGISSYQRAVEAMREFAAIPSGESSKLRSGLGALRKTLVDIAEDTSATATSACAWTLLQGLSVLEQYTFHNGRKRPLPSTRPRSSAFFGER
jgi:hypothetical protein